MRSPQGGSGTEHKIKGSYQSGQMGQTVNLLAYAFGGSNPSSPTQAEVAQLIEH